MSKQKFTVEDALRTMILCEGIKLFSEFSGIPEAHKKEIDEECLKAHNNAVKRILKMTKNDTIIETMKCEICEKEINTRDTFLTMYTTIRNLTEKETKFKFIICKTCIEKNPFKEISLYCINKNKRKEAEKQ
jgi:hypothetical protein